MQQGSAAGQGVTQQGSAGQCDLLQGSGSCSRAVGFVAGQWLCSRHGLAARQWVMQRGSR